MIFYLLNYVFIKKKRKRSGLVGTGHIFGFVKQFVLAGLGYVQKKHIMFVT